RTELSGILNWAIEGRNRLYKNQRFTTSKVSEAVVQEYREQSAPERQFFADFCQLDQHRSVTKSEGYQLYRTWIGPRGHRALSEPDFHRELQRAFGNKVIEKRPTINGVRARVYVGLSVPQPEPSDWLGTVQ